MAIFMMLVIGTTIGAVMPSKPPAPRAAQPAGAAVAEAAEVQKPVETVIQRDGNGHFFAHAQVNDEPIRFLVDTGADMVALTVQDARRAHVKFDPVDFRVIGSGASGAVRGAAVVLDEVVLDGKRVTDVHGAVVEGLDVSLLGQSYLRKIGSVHLSGDEMRLN
ncbi:MAG: TIGR02281 family clan AA aspartic protease [Sphingomonas sp.]|nr:TIGR02281 family clan AA aspartic protease [Sphingomonas sp.]